jgi:hypothetical protein
MGSGSGGGGGRAGRRTTRAAVVLGLILLGAGCSGGDDDPRSSGSSPAPAPETSGTAALASCREDHHVVVIDVAGTVTLGDETQMWVDWINAVAEPEPRPGGPELSHAYRAKGYELLYSITVPPTVLIDGLAPPLAVEAWLERNGFATGDGTRVVGYNGDSTDINVLAASITDELIRMAAEGVHLDAAYTDNDYRVYAVTAAGIPAQQVFTLGSAAGMAGTTAVAGDDLEGHRATVEGLPAVCVTP